MALEPFRPQDRSPPSSPPLRRTQQLIHPSNKQFSSSRGTPHFSFPGDSPTPRTLIPHGDSPSWRYAPQWITDHDKSPHGRVSRINFVRRPSKGVWKRRKVRREIDYVL